MNIQFMLEHADMYVQAAKLTINIALIGILLAMVIGIAGSLIKYFHIPVLSQLVSMYVEISRNTPLLVQLFFFYFGLPKIGILISSQACGIIGIAFLGGSYMEEAIRSGMESVGKIQSDTGYSLGLNRIQIMQHIILPQAISRCIPAICANIIFLIKETSVFSAIALADLMFVTKDLIGMYYETDTALLMLVISYLIILLPISFVFTLLERKVRYAEYGH